jgi:hypothetical protein
MAQSRSDGRVKALLAFKRRHAAGRDHVALLGNIYLHFVQDLWTKKVIVKQNQGSVMFRRYADDSILCFEKKADAEA